MISSLPTWLMQAPEPPAPGFKAPSGEDFNIPPMFEGVPVLEYVDKPAKFDEVVEQDGVRVLIDSKALFSIIGSEMDWKEDALRYA